MKEKTQNPDLGRFEESMNYKESTNPHSAETYGKVIIWTVLRTSDGSKWWNRYVGDPIREV